MAARDPWAFQRWAYNVETGSPLRKSVLASLATMADKNTGRCEARQSTLAQQTEICERAIRGHLVALELAGVVARRHQYRRDGRRRGDEYLLLAPWVTEWPDGEPLPAYRAGSNRAPLPASHAAHHRQQVPVIKELEEPPRAAPLVPPLNRMRASALMRFAREHGEQESLASARLWEAADAVADAKSCSRPTPDHIGRLSERFADRDLAAEAEEFEHYWLHGHGENGGVRDVVRTLNNWLKRAPSAAARRRRRPSRNGGVSPRREAERMAALRAELADAGAGWAQ